MKGNMTGACKTSRGREEQELIVSFNAKMRSREIKVQGDGLKTKEICFQKV